MSEQKIAPVLRDDEIINALRPMYHDAVTRETILEVNLMEARAIEQAVLARVGAVREQALEQAAQIVEDVGNVTRYVIADAIRALKGTPAAAVAALPVIPGTPPRIWLVLGDDGDEPANFDELGEVTWCAHPQGPGDIEYVLAQPSTNPGPLAAVAAEYNEWIQYHAAGNGDFDDFLKMVNERAAIAASKEGTAS